MDYQLLLEATGMLLASLLLYYLWKYKTSTNTNAPEPKGAWPIIGHLHLLGRKTPVFRTLAAMADKHGPIFTIQIGMRRALVVSNKETIMECFTTNDRAFLTRPKSAAVKYMGYDGAISALGPHGPYWRELRKVMTLELLSNRRLELMKHMRASEVGLCINDLYSLCVKQLNGATKLDVTHWFEQVTMNLMLRAIAGRLYALGVDEKDGEDRLFTRAMQQFMFLLGAFEFSDVIPFIEWMDLQGHVRSMKQIAKVMESFMSRWLEEHIQSRKNGLVKEEHDFMDVLLSLFPGDGVAYGHSCRNIIKGTALSLILGGSDTTTASMTWALSLLLNHNKYIKLIQQELDTHVGRERWVEESDIKDLIYQSPRHTHARMDRSWMLKDRRSKDYEDGVESFLNFAIIHAKDFHSIRCPCIVCGNLKSANIGRRFNFVNPSAIFGTSIKLAGRSKSNLLASLLKDVENDKLVFVPYNLGVHWILLVIDLSSSTIHYLDSLQPEKIQPNIQVIFAAAMRIYDSSKSIPRKRSLTWINVKCPRQPTNIECGFYVMRYMKDLIADESILSKKNFNGKTTYTQAEIDEVRVEWMNCVLEYDI